MDPITWTPTGGLDMDTAFPLVRNTSYVDAWYFRVQPDRKGNGDKGRKLGGTLEIPWAAPAAGVNTAIGSYTDPRTDNIVIFIHNDAGNHSVIWHHPKEPTARTITIPELDFTPTSFVTGAAMFDGHLLAFTDGENPLRFVDLAKADETNKKSVIRLYIPPYTDGINSRSLVARMVTNGVPAPIFTSISTVTAQDVFDVRPMLLAFANGLDSNLVGTVFTSDPCSGFIEMTASTAGNHTIEARVIDNTTSGTVTTNCLVEHFNRYNAQWDQWQINLATVMPVLPPNVSARNDASYPGGQVAGRAWQFCVAYRYKDNRRSHTGPISDVVVPALSVCGASTQPNTIDIDLSNDGWLDFPPIRGEIEDIDIHVRETDAGAWMLAKTVTKAEWAHNRVFQFRNDTTNPYSDSAFVNTAVNSHPHTALAMCGGADKDNNQRLVVSNVEEGDSPPCVQIEAHVDFEGNALEQVPTGSVSMTIRVIRYGNTNNNYRTKQPIWQRSAGGKYIFGGFTGVAATDQEDVGQYFGKGVEGFVVFAAGTQNYAISRQVVLPAPLGGISFISGTTVLDGTTPAKRSAIRSIIDGTSGGDFISQATITGLESGKTYVIRMADHQCGFFESGDPESGQLNDLNSPGIRWQGTSGNAFRFGTNAGPNVQPGLFECRVTIPVTGGNVDIGEVLVADCPTQTAHRLWLLDRDAVNHSATDDIRSLGYPAHLQVFQTNLEAFGGGGFIFTNTPADPGWDYLDHMNWDRYVTTDHNGRAFIFGVNPSLGYDASWISSGITPNAVGDDKWHANSSIYGPPADFTVQPGLSNTNGLHEYLVPNLQPTAHDRIMTNVVANYFDGNGAPVSGVLAVMTRGGTALSDAAGRVSIPAYVDVEPMLNRRDDSLISSSGSTCRMVMLPEINPFQIFPYQFAGNWSGQVGFILPDTIVTVSGQIVSRCLARGGTYPLGIYMKRDDGSRTPVKWVGDLRIPMHGTDLHLYDPFRWTVTTFNNGLAVIDFVLSGPVPIPKHGRFVSLHFVIGGDARKDTMLQWVAGECVYAIEFDETDSKPVPAPNNSPAQASELYINIGMGLTRKRAVTTGFLPGWAFEKGDRLRVITDSNGVPLTRVVDMEVTGQRGDFIVVRHSSADPVMRGGEHIEIVRPGNVQTETGGRVYYDFAGWHVLVNDPYGNPTWSTTSGTLRGGDTWMLPTEVPWRTSDTRPWSIRRVVRESRHPTDFTDDKSWGRGKVWLEDNSQTDTRYGMKHEYSNPYRATSQVNGINLFNFAYFENSDHDLGSVQAMVNAGGVILSVCDNGTVSFYKTEQPIQVGADASMKVAGGFLASNRVSDARLGTSHRQSVVVLPRGGVVWYNHKEGQMVQYASNEPIDISSPFRCGSFFRELGFTMPKDTKVVAGFDPSTKEVVLTFARHVADDGYQQYDIDGKSILYHDQSNTFVCKTLDTPDVWATAAASLWAFADGKLWNVGHPSAPLNFRFGVQRDLSVTLVAAYPGLNPNSPHKITVWRDGGWSVSRVTGANGGDSEIPPSKFEIDGSGRTGAAFMNDRSSPRNQQGRGLSTGAYLMDIAYLVELSHPGPEPCHLFQVEIGLETVQG